MRRKDRQQDEAFARTVLKNCEYATLATVSPDNTPYCVPISPVLQENNLYFHGALEGEKLKNIASENRVCISAVTYTKRVPEKFTTEYESAVAFGTCRTVEDQEEKIMALRLICEKYAQSNLEKFDEAIAQSLARTGVFCVAIQSLTGKAKRYPPQDK